MNPSSSDVKTLQHQYDALSKKTLKSEAKNCIIRRAKLAEREINFSEMDEHTLNQLQTTDEYDFELNKFDVAGFDVSIKNDLLAEALESLPEDKRNIILMSFFLDMNDEKIGKMLNVVRSTVFRKRKSALRNIRKYMEGNADDKN